jgi:hypothetical protein
MIPPPARNSLYRHSSLDRIPYCEQILHSFQYVYKSTSLQYVFIYASLNRCWPNDANYKPSPSVPCLTYCIRDVNSSQQKTNTGSIWHTATYYKQKIKLASIVLTGVLYTSFDYGLGKTRINVKTFSRRHREKSQETFVKQQTILKTFSSHTERSPQSKEEPSE